MTWGIKVGKKVTCRASPEGILTNIEVDGSITIRLLALGAKNKYDSIGDARLAQ